MRSGRGLQGDGVHAGYLEETIFEQLYDFQAALRKLLGLIGMLGGDAIKARDEFVYARIIFHGGGAEGIHAQVDGVIPSGKTGEVTQNFDFAYFGKIRDALVAIMMAQ